MTNNSLELKEEGMQQALSNNNVAPWRNRFEAVVGAMAPGHKFTSEDVIAIVGLPSGEIGTNKNNAVGAMMNALAKRSIIEKHGRVPSLRESSHGAELTLWIRSY